MLYININAVFSPVVISRAEVDGCLVELSVRLSIEEQVGVNVLRELLLIVELGIIIILQHRVTDVLGFSQERVK